MTERSAAIITFGCQMNKYDSERLAGILMEAGYTMKEKVAEADVVVFNTCCVRENADDRLYGRLGALLPMKKRRPGFQIAVGGCLAQKDKDHVFERAPHVDVVFGTHNASQLPELLEEARQAGQVASVPVTGLSPDEEALSSYRQERVRAWLPISIGCDNFCTYCIVPHVRGRERSVTMDALLGRVRELVGDGVLDLTLLGQNVNSYGKDLGLEDGFAELVRRVDRDSGIRRLRFTTSHPRDFSDAIIDSLAGASSLCRHIHLPFQAGSDRILSAIKRGYTAEWYLKRVAAIRSAMPDVSLTTDIIVGFPVETEEDFEETLRVVSEVEFDSAFTFIYSPRSGTPAARFEERLPDEVTTDRMERLLQVQNPISHRLIGRFVGSDIEVLVEGRSKKDPERLTGRTRENKLVHFAGTDDLIDMIQTVRIDEAHSWSLRGTLVPS